MVDAQEQIEKFQEFIELNYQKKLQNLIRKGKKSLLIDFSELAKHDPELSEQLLEDPENTIKAAEIAIDQFDSKEKLKVRFKNLPESQRILIRDIRAKDIGSFIFFEGIVRQSSDIRPQVVTAKFECPSCGTSITIIQTDKKFKEPSRCSCGRKGHFRLLHKELVDAQRLVIEEAAEDLDGGAQPKRMTVFLKEDLVEPKMEKKTTPGTKVKVSGIVSEVSRTLPTGGTQTIFDLVMNANYIEPIQEDFSDIEINSEDEEEIKKLANDPKIFDRLARSIAPSIMGHEEIKEALLLQLMGGVRKQKEDGTIVRGDMHILLVGDPGSGKSAMLTFIAKAAPKARYIAGKGTSGAGISASVVKDEFLRGWALEAGAMVLANKGICVLDEMDKMAEEDTSALHEAMEQQSYHPDFKIMFADGSVESIGEFVDNLIESNKPQVIQGKDCEILPTEDYEVLTTDFNKIKPIKVNRVSRHKAPKYFIEVLFSNGRKIKVTPEHPFFVYTDEGYKEIGAEDLKIGFFIPAPQEFLKEKNNLMKELPNSDLGLVTIKSIKKIPNKDIKWVYDVTVEPNHTFISEGIVLHNTITIAKANIQATLKAQTTVLAAANPKFGRFDPYKTVAEQIDMPPALINRFDLIFPIRDLPDRVKDSKIAQHILEQHKEPKSVKPEIPVKTLRKYIAYAKQRINPVLTEPAMQEIKRFYVGLRTSEQVTSDTTKPIPTIPITPRQLEALIRLAEGSARIRLSAKITKTDSKRAITLLKSCLSKVGIDLETGQIDIDVMHTGIPSSKRNKIAVILHIIDSAEKKGQKTLAIEDLLTEAEEKHIERRQAEEIIEKLKREGELFEPKQGFIQKV